MTTETNETVAEKASDKRLTKKIACSGCGRPMTVDANAVSGTCWKCMNDKVNGTVPEGATTPTEKPAPVKAAKAPKAEGAAPARKTKNGDGHMSVSAIRARFDNPPIRAKHGFFQDVFAIIKTAGTISIHEVAEKAFKLPNKPPKYADVAAMEKQVASYCSVMWGRAVGLVRVEEGKAIYTGKDAKK